MEPVTHFLTGACLSRTGFHRKTAYATLTMVLAAEASDIDMLGYFHGSPFGFAHHRGFTHTVWGIPIVSALVLLFVYLWHTTKQRLRPADPHHPADQAPPLAPNWKLLFGLSLIAGYSHILLDFTNNYGVRPFWPLVNRWYSWDIVFIVEPLILLFLVGGLVLPSLFGLINQEIGARSRGPRGRGGAITALVLVVLLWGFRDYQHRRALAMMDSLLYQNVPPQRIGAYPYQTNPFMWHGVVETDDFYQTVKIDSLRGEVDPQGRSLTYYKSQDSPQLEAAKSSYLGRVYLDWARFPSFEVEKRDDPAGYLVRMRDLRFAYPERRGTPLACYVVLDGDNRVLRQGFSAANPVRDRMEHSSQPSQEE